MKSNGTGMAASDERVDYVVVDQQRTQALKSTREAWNDGRQSTETDNPSKGPKWPCCSKCHPTLQIPKLLGLLNERRLWFVFWDSPVIVFRLGKFISV